MISFTKRSVCSLLAATIICAGGEHLFAAGDTLDFHTQKTGYFDQSSEQSSQSDMNSEDNCCKPRCCKPRCCKPRCCPKPKPCCPKPCCPKPRPCCPKPACGCKPRCNSSCGCNSNNERDSDDNEQYSKRRRYHQTGDTRARYYQPASKSGQDL